MRPYIIDPKVFAEKQTVSEATWVLLMADENGKMMKAVAGVDKDGKVKTVAPTKENADSFLQIDARGNALENFCKKFSSQFKNPSHTGER
ncbi:MAG: hypothetical protein LBH61_04080 [Dysgonamonadaceae bacterium]|nr:hypothetical protein [Dysgonamonadaceae bacterium]